MEGLAVAVGEAVHLLLFLSLMALWKAFLVALLPGRGGNLPSSFRRLHVVEA